VDVFHWIVLFVESPEPHVVDVGGSRDESVAKLDTVRLRVGTKIATSLLADFSGEQQSLKDEEQVLDPLFLPPSDAGVDLSYGDRCPRQKVRLRDQFGDQLGKGLVTPEPSNNHVRVEQNFRQALTVQPGSLT
jgi:hypothetical protein